MLLFVDQNVSGAVNTSTSASVQYAYSQPTGANYSRLTAMTYPNGRVLDYGYNSGIDSAISRVSYLKDDGGSSAGVHLADYLYLGLGTIVQQNSPEASTELTYIHQTGDTLSSSDGGDRYTGLDRFGRVLDQYYLNTSTGTATDRLQYGYDRDGNVLYAKNLVNGAFSELYHANSASTGDNNTAYDPLNRLTTFRRGTLTSSGNNGASLDTITTANLNSTTGVPNADSWSLDAIGNWNSSAPGGTTVSNSFNSKNEETANGSSSLTFDANGNMLTDGSGLTYHYDAWNRLVQVTDASSTVQMSRSYDALGRADGYNSPASGYLYWYYTTQNQCIEETSGSSYVQYVWGLGYQNQLVLRDRNVSFSGNLGKTGSNLSERLYVQQDANYNVISLTSQTGSGVTARFVYDPYGTQTALNGSWAAASNTLAWQYNFQGGRQEGAGNLIIFGARLYDPALGRWIQQDPAGYADGSNLYQSEDSNPTDEIDPLGTVGAGAHHSYPKHLGGAIKQLMPPKLNAAEHTAAHKVFRDAGMGGPSCSKLENDFGRAKWAEMSEAEQRALITDSLKAAGIGDEWIAANMDAIMSGATPGVVQKAGGEALLGGAIGGAVLIVLLSDNVAGWASIVDPPFIQQQLRAAINSIYRSNCPQRGKILQDLLSKVASSVHPTPVYMGRSVPMWGYTLFGIFNDAVLGKDIWVNEDLPDWNVVFQATASANAAIGACQKCCK